jgi:hypothetical protein
LLQKFNRALKKAECSPLLQFVMPCCQCELCFSIRRVDLKNVLWHIVQLLVRDVATTTFGSFCHTSATGSVFTPQFCSLQLQPQLQTSTFAKSPGTECPSNPEPCKSFHDTTQVVEFLISHQIIVSFPN